MATTTRVIDANVSGTVYTTDLNDALEALDTSHAGSSAPTDELSEGKLWLDTSDTPATLKVYNNSNWEPIGGGILYEEKSTTHLAVAGEGVVANTSSGTWTLTLPASPVSGDVVVIVDGADFSTNNLTVARNGSTIGGLAEDLTVDIGNVKIHLVYAFGDWQVSAQTGLLPSSSSIVDNGNATAITIDSSENVLIGTANTIVGVGNTDEGICLDNGGRSFISYNGIPSYINRNGTDGDLVKFSRGGSTVGSIGTDAGIIYSGGGDAFLGFDSTYNLIKPASTSTGGGSDGLLDLGGTTRRFKDLYLSGGVYLGGTGSANLLDDYEEGTWEPTIVGTGGNPTVTYQADNGGSYTKIGRVVYYTGAVRWTALSGGSGTARIGNLPFTSAARTNGDNADSIGSARTFLWNGTSSNHPTIIGMVAGNTTLTIIANDSTGTAATLQVGDLGTTCAFQFTCIAYV